MFSLDPQLQNDTVLLASLPLCELLLMNDANYPWLILVPRREGLRELHELEDADQQQYLRESNAVAGVLQQQFQPDKLNVAALGNQVAQLHIHHIARYCEDCAWPSPVWGVAQARPYADDALDQARDRVLQGLAGTAIDFTPAA